MNHMKMKVIMSRKDRVLSDDCTKYSWLAITEQSQIVTVNTTEM